ncbi:hypothetical protein J437_LFUL004184 [Ladona fulva]|uniref:Uncharacterized protein n=1 Tax=Ladona fulva TaxID=123851 RepID=A0A8K0K423_LADFU|nr:hypothetical protein J437_LFUL004184 [Ladona fulva]
MTVPFENTRWRLLEERQRKKERYAALADHLATRGYAMSVDAIAMGSLGAWDPENDKVLQSLGILKRYCEVMKRLMVSDSIRWSRDINVEHIMVHRQYED